MHTKQYSASLNTFEINLGSLAAGVYLLNFPGVGISTKKVVVLTR